MSTGNPNLKGKGGKKLRKKSIKKAGQAPAKLGGEVPSMPDVPVRRRSSQNPWER